MKKCLDLQPKNFRQTLHFWLRRPDYGWRDLWLGSPLRVTLPESLERVPGPRGRWRIRESVNGMSTTIYVNEADLPAGDHPVRTLPSASWWKNEGRELVLDYAKYGLRNAPTGHVIIALMILSVAFLYLVTQDPSGSLAFLSDAEIPGVTKRVGLLLVGTPALSLLINRLFPTRAYLTTQIFRAEAWLLLVSALLALPELPHGIRDFRAQVLKAAGEQNSAGESLRAPAANEADPR